MNLGERVHLLRRQQVGWTQRRLGRSRRFTQTTLPALSGRTSRIQAANSLPAWRGPLARVLTICYGIVGRIGCRE